MFKSSLGAVARYTQNLGLCRAIATPFVTKVIEISGFSNPGVPGDPPWREPGGRPGAGGRGPGAAGGTPQAAGGAAGGSPGRRPAGEFFGVAFSK